MRYTWIALALIPLLTAAADHKSASHVVVIHQMKFDPATFTIEPGETVIWKNQDDRDHTVTANDGSFDSGKISSGDSFTQTFKSAGKFDYGCSYHPRMKGTITVSAK